MDDVVNLLKSFSYEDSAIVLHKDQSLINKFPHGTRFTISISEMENMPMVTIEMNKALDSLEKEPTPIFETWNPWFDPKPEHMMVNTVIFFKTRNL